MGPPNKSAAETARKHRIGRSKKTEKMNRETALVDLSSQKKGKSHKMRQTRHATNLLASYVRCTQGLSGVSYGPSAYLINERPPIFNRIGRKFIFLILSLFFALPFARPAPGAFVHPRQRPWSRDLSSLLVCRPFCSLVRYPSSFMMHSGSWFEISRRRGNPPTTARRHPLPPPPMAKPGYSDRTAPSSTHT